MLLLVLHARAAFLKGGGTFSSHLTSEITGVHWRFLEYLSSSRSQEQLGGKLRQPLQNEK